MTQEEFDKYSLNKQADIVWKIGVLIANRQEGRFTVMLYQIEGFYVEVFYSKNGKKIPGVRSFEDIKYLEPYLNEMDVNSLIA